MNSLAGVAVRSLVRSRRRYVLTSIGASLGVAVLFAVLVTSEASRTSLQDAIRGETGRADVVITPTGPFDATLPSGTRELVAGLSDVDAVAATARMRSSVLPADGVTHAHGDDPRDRIVFVSGIGPDHDRINELSRLAGRPPADGAPEVDAPASLAERLGVGLGDALAVATPNGSVPVTVTGVLADRGAATANQGSVLFTSATTVRGFLGVPDAVNSLQVDLAPGTETGAWIAANRDALAAVSVQDAAHLAAGFRGFIDGVNGALTLVAAIALFVGGFLVYLTFSVAVAERTRVLGTLRALGAVRRRVRRIVVVEAAVLGVVCAVVGLAAGYLLALVAVGVLGALLDLDLGSVGLPLGPAVFSAAVGVSVGVLAAWFPARRAARIDPVSAMRSGALAIEPPSRRWIGPALIVVGAAINALAGSISLRGLGLLMLLGGAVLSVHLAMAPLGRLAGSAITRLSPGTGAIAVRHVDRERSRSSYTLALVMVSLAAVLAVAATNRSMSDLLESILDQQAGAVQVSAPGAVDDVVGDELAAVAGVGTVSPVRFGETEIVARQLHQQSNEVRSMRRASSFLQIVDPATYFDVSGFPYVEGDEATTRAAFAAGGSILMPTPIAHRLAVEVGDTVELSTLDGPAPFTVVGTYAVLGGGFGTVASTVDLERLGGGRINGFLVGTDGTDPETVAAAVRDTVGEQHQLVVDSPADTRSFAEGQLSGFFSLGYAILAVTAVISLLGLANTLVVAVLSRTREIGVLRSYGARRRQVRAMVTVEAVTMAGIAFVLSLPLAAVMGNGLVGGQEDTLGTSLGFSFPWPLVPPLALAALAVAAVAAAIPARRAARLEIVDSLRSE